MHDWWSTVEVVPWCKVVYCVYLVDTEAEGVVKSCTDDSKTVVVPSLDDKPLQRHFGIAIVSSYGENMKLALCLRYYTNE